MPLFVKDYSWQETDAEVVLKLPLKGVKPSKVDVTATDRFIKVCARAAATQRSRCCMQFARIHTRAQWARGMTSGSVVACARAGVNGVCAEDEGAGMCGGRGMQCASWRGRGMQCASWWGRGMQCASWRGRGQQRASWKGQGMQCAPSINQA